MSSSPSDKVIGLDIESTDVRESATEQMGWVALLSSPPEIKVYDNDTRRNS